MGFWFWCPGYGFRSIYPVIFTVGFLLCLPVHADALAQPLEYNLDPHVSHSRSDGQQKLLNDLPESIPLRGFGSEPQKRIQADGAPTDTLKKLLDALDVMQSSYFEIWEGTWPTSIDWTAAVLATHVSATLSALSTNLGAVLNDSQPVAAGGFTTPKSEPFDTLVYENLINHYFLQLSTFYFGENAFSLRMQAYDDMLWVVLDWLENIKFQNTHSNLYYSSYSKANESLQSSWYGTEFRRPAAHRARLFYELASQGWDTALCNGGMIWSPYLEPYKNAITNELFISASIGMYLYFPGDDIDSPLASRSSSGVISKPHNPDYLNSAITAYRWLRNSNMTTKNGLYADGFHINGWVDKPNPGTKKCDVLDTMVYTYNQGVILSGARGLWLATGDKSYLEDAHQLIENVLKATGWPDTSNQEWQGLGRAGVLEDVCDSSGTCSQNGHTFKGIFFHHFAEFCRRISPEEEQFLSSSLHKQTAKYSPPGRQDYDWHQEKCAAYYSWIKHNAQASYMTKNEQGKFGMWWGKQYPYNDTDSNQISPLPEGAIDRMNEGPFSGDGDEPYHHPKVGTHDEICVRGHRMSPVEEKKKKETSVIDPDNVDLAFSKDVNDRGRGRTVESQSGAVAVLRALYQWENSR
ncbi:uncharacterized protein PADG_04437 [Paracoccidioides brasiliensis Pb18]|uniref:Glycosyl hydrolase n=1 Tax=Paracoccidioides brasiliensis (strain Pb18) TaxID=502780 RepID=C1GB01_PARBD|nr:uncharacterized protein PADG_04437 [Paracoccidioides brasiliensis Pb18]EEH48353.2 hypothetical protein PADG_04437 [Paracoccidioides brasiliensis Pb18]ODH52446.1 hypothetical protein GX48_01509 [Paracoccidioides brasiliensis]